MPDTLPPFLRNLLKFIQTQRLLHDQSGEAEPLIVAVSGGPDSVALLHGLVTLRDILRITPHAVTLDHGIRGDASAGDAAFVRECAEKWGVPCIVGNADVPMIAQDRKMGLEAAARQARYAFLVEIAQAIGATRIATGHTRDDQAETVLLHVIRGAGLAGLRGMSPITALHELGFAPPDSPLTLIRPLLGTSRAAINAYLTELGITARHDETNDDQTFTRNRIRHEVLPLLEGINPGVRAALARLAETARADYDALIGRLPPLVVNGDALEVPRATFLALPLAVQRLTVRHAAQKLAPGGEISFERATEAVRYVVSGGEGVIELGGSVNLHARHKLLIFKGT